MVNYEPAGILAELKAITSRFKDEEAVSHYLESLSINPNDENTHVNLGVLLAKQGKTNEAIAHYSGRQQLVVRAVVDAGVIPADLVKGVGGWYDKTPQVGTWGEWRFMD